MLRKLCDKYVKMCKLSRGLLTVYLQWLLLAVYGTESREDQRCKFGKEKNVDIAECSDLSLSDFPKNLERGIEGLYLSRNYIEEINDDTFENLPSIEYLFLDRNSGLHISSRAFAPLTKLHTLDLSYNTVVNISDVYLPESLVELHLGRMNKLPSKLPISSLHDLKILALNDNKLRQIPSFDGNLPNLERLDLANNALENFKLDGLAGLCKLKVLDISNDKLSIQDDCECWKLKEWIKSHSIKSSKINCKSSELDKNCSTSPSDAFVRQFESCGKEADGRKFVTILIYCLSIVGIIFAICYSCVILYVFCNRKNYSDDTIRAYFCCKKKPRRAVEELS